MLKKYTSILIIIILSTIVAQNNSIITPSSIRTSNSLKYCHNTKSNLITLSDRNLNNNFFTNLNAYFATYTNSLPNGIINRDTITITNQIQKMGFLTIVAYASPFFSGFIILIFLIFLSICIFVCPQTCPPRKCQKSSELFYSKKQLILPNIYSMVIFCMVIGFSITGIYYSSILNNNIENVQCGFSMILDDMLNGNISYGKNNTFFGLSNLVKSTNLILLSLQNNFAQLNLTNVLSNFQTNSLNMLNDLQLLSDGIVHNSTFNLTYNSFSPPYLGTVQSSFGSVLGNPNNNNSLIGQFYNYVLYIKDSVNSFSQFLNYIQPFITNNLQIILYQFSQYNQYISSTNSNFAQILVQVDNYKPYLMYTAYSYFGFIILSILIGITSVLMISCKKISWRKTLYSFFFILWLASLISFLMSCLMILIIPFLFLECRAANESLNSDLAFTNFMSQFGMSMNDSSTLSTCINKNGDFLINLSNTYNTIINNITNFQNILNNNAINLNNLLINTTSIIVNYNTGYINDVLSDFNTNLWFQNVANRTQFMSVCNSNSDYLADSFVPSTSNYSLNSIPCANGISLSNVCTTINTCTNGCMDLNNLMFNQINLTTFQNNIKSKFSGICGITISSEFTYLYNNWFLPRIDNSTGIQSVYNRFTAVNNSVTTDGNLLLANLNTISNQNKNYLNGVANQLKILIDNNTGIFSGRNCTVIGEDIILAKDTICVSVFNNIYILLIVIGIISYLIMIGLCCVVWSRFRYQKQHEKYQQTDIKNKIRLEKKPVPEKSYTEGQQQQQQK